LTTFILLRDTVLKYALREGNTDTSDLVPTFLLHLEAKLNRRLRIADMFVTSTETAVASKVAFPSDYQQLIKVKTSGQTSDYVLNYISPRLFNSKDATTFTIEGTNIVVADDYATSAFDIDYYGDVPALTEASPTNWLLSAHYDMMLYGVLSELHKRSGDDAELLKYTQLFEAALAGIQASDNAKYESDGIPATVISSNFNIV
jgi:hypothetical protein